VPPKPSARTLELAFGLAVRQHRERMQLSQEELGFRADLHRTYISMLERGQRCPSLATIAKLAKALETKGSALIAAAERVPASGL
jgi:transcriptional regulator with XRE-family HTH domain